MEEQKIVVLDTERTPFCEFIGSPKDGTGGRAGKLADLSAPQLGAVAARGVLRAAGVPKELIDHIVFGMAEQNHNDDFYGARYVGLELGMIEVPALTVARICGSGAQAIVTATQMLMLGDAQYVLAGGMESLSGSPHILRGLRQGVPLMQPPPLEDLFAGHLYDRFAKMMMGGTANKLGRMHKVTRQECDEFAFTSISRAIEAQDSGFLAREIVPVQLFNRKGQPAGVVEADDHIHRSSSLEKLLALQPVPLFGDRKRGLVTAGNASGMVDGAVAMILTTEERAKSDNFKPIGRIVSWGYGACQPDIMGYGPIPATLSALGKAGLTIDDLGVVELNEAFAPIAVVGMRELKVPHDKFNPNGGAIALGHPLGATGARLIATVLNYLHLQGGSPFGLATMCIGAGQGIAVVVEAL